VSTPVARARRHGEDAVATPANIVTIARLVLAVPTLLVQPRNDPFLAPEAYPWAEAEANPHFFLEAPESGGHVGFLDLKNGLQPWSERRAAEFLAVHG